MRAEHLKIAVKSGSPVTSEKAAGLICHLSNLLLSGGLPGEVAPYFCGARLHGAQKKDGGVRPIAVREILRRLTLKCAVAAVADKAAGLLSPLQLDVGVRNGCEALVHTVRRLLDQEPEDLYLLQVDFVNAFNLADRSAAYEEAKNMLPELTH